MKKENFKRAGEIQDELRELERLQRACKLHDQSTLYLRWNLQLKCLMKYFNDDPTELRTSKELTKKLIALFDEHIDSLKQEFESL